MCVMNIVLHFTGIKPTPILHRSVYDILPLKEDCAKERCSECGHVLVGAANTTQKCPLADRRFFETYGVINDGSGWRKEVCVCVLSLIHI